VRTTDALPGRRWQSAAEVLALAIWFWLALSASAPHARAQERTTPTQSYKAAFGTLYEGEYRDALDLFRAEGRGAIKTPQSRWIDSICYYTMAGECYYHMGQLPQALEHYTAALKLYVAFYDWMIRVQFPPTIQPAGQGAYKAIPWGASRRRARLGHYPGSMLIAQGKININDEVRYGGVVQQATLYPIEVQEIVRCTALAIRRRARLLGPLSQHDPLTQEVVAALARRPGPPNHWSEAWIDVQLGLALSAAGKAAQAIPQLQRSLLAAGEFDHPLTSTALLELGRLALVRGDFAMASNFFEEASYSAVYYGDATVLDEAFRGGALAHLLANRKGIFAPMEAAIGWSKVKDLRQLQASLLLLAAENFAALGQTPRAARLLDDARVAIGRRQMGSGWIGARATFLRSLVMFQQGKLAEGDSSLASAMAYMQQGSHWLFQIGLADNLYTSGAATPRVAMDLYNSLLRDPQPADWSSDPMESMAVLVTPHLPAIEHWFEVALQRKEHETALEISDRARRHRFFSSLPFGGRLESLRWMLAGPLDALDETAQIQRQDLLARYPAYQKLDEQARASRARLAATPLVPEDPETFKKQSKEFTSLADIAVQQEVILREIAVRREPAALIFPPLRSTRDIQKSLPDRHALLAFFATSRRMYAFLMNNQQYAYWEVKMPATVGRQMVGLLHQMGHFAPSSELGLKDLADDKWKQAARQLLDYLLKDSRADFSKEFDELVVVPDGVLWYLPFEMLQVEVEGQLRPLISRFRLRYAPTVSLAVSTRQGRKPGGTTAVVLGKLFPRDEDTVAKTAFDQIAASLPGCVAIKTPLPAPSAVYSALFDRLIVLDDINLGDGGPYRWAPMSVDRGKAGNALGDWMPLPFAGPEEIVLPGFHTMAEDSLKRMSRTAPGHEVFLSVCGLMASGARTLLLSRWRTGGQTSFDLVREFVQELPHTLPADAWQRSVLLAAATRLNLEAEPRIKDAADETPRAVHPFFWAGYMLIDSGAPQPKPEAKPDEPMLKFKKLEKPDEAPQKEDEAPQGKEPTDAPGLKVEKPGAPAEDLGNPAGRDPPEKPARKTKPRKS